MEIVIGPRRSGKSTALKEWVLEGYRAWLESGDVDHEFRIAVVVGRPYRDEMLKAIRNIHPQAPEHLVVTYEDLESGRMRGRNNFILGLDDVEYLFLRAGNGLGVGMVTVTSEDKVRNLAPEPWNAPDYGDFPMNVGESLTPSP